MRRAEGAALAAVLALAALLRFGGISHDLHEGFVYHPDVAKQIHAVQRFARGEYYRHIGNKDYDGYPLFHAHLLEYFVRAAEPVRRGVLAVLGVPARPGGLLEDRALYWLMLLMNAALSTGAVALVYRIGRENLGRPAAWGATLLMAFSPADVTATHLATGDAAAGFFATLSLLYSLRVLRLGRARDYLLAAGVGSLAFAAKYYAAMAFFPLLAAHLARSGPPRAWITPRSLGRLALAAAGAVLGLVAAVPSLLTHASGELRDIVQAMLVSSQRLDPRLEGAGWWARYVHAMRSNVPPLWRVLGPATGIGVVAAAVSRVRLDPRVWVLAVGPVAYWVFGVGSRAAIHPVYHVVMTGALFLLAAHALLRSAPPEAPGGWARLGRGAGLVAGAVVVALGAAFLARESAREVFFWRLMDSQRLAAAWVAENVPPTWAERRGRYTVSMRRPPPPGREEGTVFVSGGLAPLRVPPEAVPLARFDLERAPLTQFRNVPVEVFAARAAPLRAGYVLPLLPPWPSESGNDVVFDAAPGLLRRGTVVEVPPGAGPVRRTYVADRALGELWVAARAGGRPARVRVEFGGREAVLDLEAGGSGHARIDRPVAGFPSAGGRRYYAWRIDTGGAHARVEIAADPGAAGRMLFRLGAHAEALPLLGQGALEGGDPAAAAAAAVAGTLAGTPVGDDGLIALARMAGEAADGATLLEVYGIGARLLDGLPYASFGPEQLGARGFGPLPAVGGGAEAELLPGRRRGHEEGEPAEVWTPDLLLDPGHFVARVGLRAVEPDAPGEVVMVLADLGGTVLAEKRVDLPASDPRLRFELEFPFAVPAGGPGVRVLARWPGEPGTAVRGIRIAPDAAADARGLARAARAALSGDPATGADEPLACEVRLALGAPFEGETDRERARACYRAAIAPPEEEAGP